MIQPVSCAHPGFFLNVIRIQNLQGGRLVVPVDPAQSVYARFKHIQGVPARDGGVPLFRLRVLDSLIDRLLRYGQEAPTPDRLRNLSPAALDPLIGQLQDQLHRYLLRLPLSFGGAYPETGMLIDLVA